METVQPKVHHHRHRRNESRHRRRHGEHHQQQQKQKQDDQQQQQETTQATSEQIQLNEEQQQKQQIELQESQLTLQEIIDEPATSATTVTTITSYEDAPINEMNVMSRTTSAGTTTSTISRSSSQQTVLLVNGELPPPDVAATTATDPDEPISVVVVNTNQMAQITVEEIRPAHHDDDVDQTPASQAQTQTANSSRNSSGDAQSLKETLQRLRPQLTTTKKGSSSSGGNVASNNTTIGDGGSSNRPHHHHHHSQHRHRERERDRASRSPRETSASGSAVSTVGGVVDRAGILGFMERELRQCSPTPSTARSVGGASGSRKMPSSLSDDPQASPAQRSIRSRSSLEKSPRRKRSKSESRRRRERKLIAAGEMEVRQANETLMRYLKQCSEMNDASLSGELEIDQSYDERRVHRKTKSQRDKRGHLISKLYSAGGGLSSLLRELSDDIVPAEGEEIYNPFTPVVSPTEDNAPAHIDKMFLQTSSGYRPVERCYYKHHHHINSNAASAIASSGGAGAVGDVGSGRFSNSCGSSGAVRLNAGYGFLNARGRHIIVGGSRASSGGTPNVDANGAHALHASDSFGDDVRCLLDADECNGHEIRTNIQLACMVQRVWRLLANICHGFLAGLALAHLLFVLSSPHQMDWAKILLSQLNNVEVASASTSPTAMTMTAAGSAIESATPTIPKKTTFYDDGGGSSDFGDSNNTNTNRIPNLMMAHTTISHEIISDYATFAGIYLNAFYFLAILCLVSVLDRLDICRWNLSNTSEFISFRWLIIAMIYIATIILTVCSDTIDEKFYYNNNVNVTLTEREIFTKSLLNIWSSLSVTRSISAIAGWIMIGLTPFEDMLYENLVDLAKYQMTNN